MTRLRGCRKNIAAMTASPSARGRSGVTRAVRDSMTDAGPVREGDWIGLSRDGIVAIADSVVGAFVCLLAACHRTSTSSSRSSRG